MAKEEPEKVEAVEEDEEEVVDEETAKRNKMSGKADLEKVTDYAEEKEIDTNSLSQAMDRINSNVQSDAQKQSERAATLAKVKISADDVKLIADQMEVSTDDAEVKLREHGGDVVAALRALINPSAALVSA